MNKNVVVNGLSIGPSAAFIETPAIRKVLDRALAYLEVGVPVHLTGPTGTGKSTLAMHLAHRLNQPVMLMFGDDGFATADLVGETVGYRKSKLIDNFIHSVVKTEENVMQRWVDNRLTTACKEGFTLVYDEFNRSRPEANNALLSVLEEGILTLPPSEDESGYIKVHPNFRAIFTSNPYEYSGVHKTQDALLDRMVSIYLGYFDEETERAIVVAQAGIACEDAEKIVAILRDFRHIVGDRRAISIRPAIVIGKIIRQKGMHVEEDIATFIDICADALIAGKYSSQQREELVGTIANLIHRHVQDRVVLSLS